ncbi:traB domain-containing protein [Onthophagus taurus]|uniref:traB domain-containing protein n=1 Tax=Onthophagus taurus TaxID=166361 RepID=UPI0039BE7C5C
MDVSNFELSESTVKIGSDSEPSSEKSFEEIDDETKHTIEHEEFDKCLPQTVTLLQHPQTGAKVYVVGTAHFSQESKDEVVKVINTVLPHIVILELCDARKNILQMDEKAILEQAENINLEMIRGMIKKNGLYYGVTYLLLLNLSAHLTKQIGMAPGGEFRVAFKEASRLGSEVVLGDRPIRITLLRALAKLSLYQKIKLAWYLLFSRDPISKEEIEKCKNRDMLEQLLADMSGEYPVLGEVFVDERDAFLTYTLQTAALKDPARYIPTENVLNENLRIVAVVGIGHAIGISKLWPIDQRSKIKEILTVPPPSMSTKIIKMSFKLSMMTLACYLAYKYVPVPKSLRDISNQAFQKVATRIKDYTY